LPNAIMPNYDNFLIWRRKNKIPATTYIALTSCVVWCLKQRVDEFIHTHMVHSNYNWISLYAYLAEFI